MPVLFTHVCLPAMKYTNCHQDTRGVTRFFACCLLPLLITLTGIAQPADLNFINFSNKDGLSSNIVHAIVKDKFGYMWFATDDGLNKFDGVNFTVYRNNHADSTSISGNTIFALHEDAAGNLWIGTNTSLSLYNRKKDAFINYDFAGKNIIRALCTDHAGNLWVGSFNGLYQFNPVSGAIHRYQGEPGKPGALASNTVISVFEDSHRRLWAGTTSGLHLFQPSTNSFQRFVHIAGDSTSLSDNTVKAITEDSLGNTWFGTMDGGLNRLEADGKRFTSYKHRDALNTLSSNRIYSMGTDNTGKLLVATENGLDIFNTQTASVLRVGNDGRNSFSLNGKSVRSIFIDNNGVYWVGSFRGGVNKYDRNLAFFNLRQSNPFDPAGLSHSIVTSFVEDDNGDVYVGTEGGGLNLYHRKTGLFRHVMLPGKTESSSLAILTLERAGNELWIGTFLHGLYVLDMKNGRVRQYQKGDGPADLSSNEIFCLRKDRDNNVWVGTNGGGINIWDPKSRRFNKFGQQFPYTQGGILPTKGYIRSIEEDSRGRIWIGSAGSGVTMYDKNTARFQDFNHANSNLPNDEVQTIFIGKHDTLWAGTHGGGLSRLDYASGKFVSFDESEGIANAVVYKVLEDQAGRLWLSTNKGISRFDTHTSRFKNYSADNGVQRSSFVLGAGLKTKAGDIFFGGLDGFNYFDPQKFSCNKNVPDIVLTDLKVANQTVQPGSKAPIQEHISIAHEIKLGYKQNFSIDFVALNYSAPRETRYSYMLEGFDKTWSPPGHARTAVFSNLDPGTYCFRVKASGDDGAWNTPAKNITIIIQPPFYLTRTAWFLYVLAAGLLLWAIRYRGIQKLKNKFAIEQERLQVKQMIEQKNRDAAQLRAFEEAKVKYLMNVSHEFRTPVSLIVGPVETLLQQEGDPAKKNQLSLIKRNARRLLNLVNQVLDFRQLEAHETKLYPSEGDLIAFINELVVSFKDISERKHIHFTFSTTLDRYYTAFDGEKIERILFNLLSNAFKFTPRGGDISLSIEKSNTEGISIAVKDTGVGIDKSATGQVFDRFFQAPADGVLNQGSGIGLSITREFVKLHGGSIEAESISGKGSTFTVQLPLPLMEEPVQAKHALYDNSILLEKPAHDTPASEMLTLLLVEDNEDFRYYLKDNLRHHYKIVEAADGKEGWQKALAAHPQVIVSDISMPYMDGIELCQKIKSDKRTGHIPVILLTALTGDAHQLKGLETGANDYLTKPFNFQILNARIKNLFELNQSLKNTYTRQLKIVSPEITVESEDDKLMRAVAAYIEDNLNSTKLSVEDLSRHVCMSRGTFYSKIVALTGETPVEYIRSVKLNKAAALLENSDMKIAQIGYAVGFTTPNYFARAFKTKFNMLPSEYLQFKRQGKAAGLELRPTS